MRLIEIFALGDFGFKHAYLLKPSLDKGVPSPLAPLPDLEPSRHRPVVLAGVAKQGLRI